MHSDQWETEMQRLVYSSLDQKEIRVIVGDVELMVEVASTPPSRAAGLSGREELPSDGMLFMYDGDHMSPYHRTDMAFDVAIRFFDKQGELVHEDASDSRVVESPKPFRYVLESALDRVLSGRLRIPGFS
jgi:uncharacterized membrane protein (UPF0127 family)